MNQKQIQENNQQSEVIISEELVKKFDGDEELIAKFLSNGYTVQQLEQSQITHPTATDPVVTLNNGKIAGFWLP